MLTRNTAELLGSLKGYPEFRRSERAMLHGLALRRLGKDDEALSVLRSALDEEPLLETSRDFMWILLTTEYGSTDAVSKWQQNRVLGKSDPAKGIVVDVD